MRKIIPLILALSLTACASSEPAPVNDTAPETAAAAVDTTIDTTTDTTISDNDTEAETEEFTLSQEELDALIAEELAKRAETPDTIDTITHELYYDYFCDLMPEMGTLTYEQFKMRIKDLPENEYDVSITGEDTVTADGAQVIGVRISKIGTYDSSNITFMSMNTFSDPTTLQGVTYACPSGKWMIFTDYSKHSDTLNYSCFGNGNTFNKASLEDCEITVFGEPLPHE